MADLFDRTDCFAEFAHIRSILRYGDPAKCPSPQISVLIPQYKRPEFLKKALESILVQDYPGEFEIVIVDDDVRADNGVLEVVQSLDSDRILYYQNEQNLRGYGNHNRCIELARAENIVFCHNDDLLMPDALSWLMSIKRSGREMIFSAHDNVDGDGNVAYRDSYPRKFLFFKEKPFSKASLYYFFIQGSGCPTGWLMSRSALMELGGGFRREYSPCADYALLFRYTKDFGCILSNRPVYYYRVAENRSFELYDVLSKRDRAILQDVKPYIHLPERLLDYLIDIRCRNTDAWNAVIFAHADRSRLKAAPLRERLCLKFFRIFAWAGRFV